MPQSDWKLKTSFFLRKLIISFQFIVWFMLIYQFPDLIETIMHAKFFIHFYRDNINIETISLRKSLVAIFAEGLVFPLFSLIIVFLNKLSAKNLSE